MSDHAKEDTWSCTKCTLVHSGRKRHYLACELCSSDRPSNQSNASRPTFEAAPKVGPIPQSPPKVPLKEAPQSPSLSSLGRPSSINARKRLPVSTTWGSLRPPSEKDVYGPRKRQRVLDAPPPMFDYLIVLDFEWTADNKKRMEPVAEITQFPSVAMRLFPTKKGPPTTTPTTIPKGTDKATYFANIPLPFDLTALSFDMRATYDACAVSAFDTFVRPTFNPRLSQFSIDLTAIRQDQVDSAPTVDVALQRYISWLQSLDLVDEEGRRTSSTNWCFVTWGDGDIMETLRRELQYKSIQLPPCFDKWINLKCGSVFKKHYGREPRGGLRSCVESVGAIWEGRAHNGLVDSINTAKIVRHMVQTGFRFTKSTRGLGKDGVPFGRKKR